MIKDELINKLFRDWFSIQELKRRLAKTFTRVFLEVVFVHELSSCRKKYEFFNKLSFEDFVKYTQLINFGNILLGTIVEHGIKAILGYNPYPKFFMKTINVQVDDGEIDFLVVGAPDIYDRERNEVVEIKFTFAREVKLREKYVIQAGLYGWLMDVDKVTVLVVNNRGVVEEFEVKAFTTKEVEQHIKKWWKTQPLFPFECSYCPFQNECPIRRQVVEKVEEEKLFLEDLI